MPKKRDKPCRGCGMGDVSMVQPHRETWVQVVQSDSDTRYALLCCLGLFRLLGKFACLAAQVLHTPIDVEANERDKGNDDGEVKGAHGVSQRLPIIPQDIAAVRQGKGPGE